MKKKTTATPLFHRGVFLKFEKNEICEAGSDKVHPLGGPLKFFFRKTSGFFSKKRLKPKNSIRRKI